MVSKCWKTLATDCLRRVFWAGFLPMVSLLFVAIAHARVSPANGASSGDPSAPKGTPAPPATFGIGPGDSVFDGGGDFRWPITGAATASSV